MKLNLQFGHGLGDCVNFGRVLKLYEARGYSFAIQVEENKIPLFQCFADEAGTDIAEARFVPWYDRNDVPGEGAEQYWLYNKIAKNISVSPLPEIGSPESLWPELCATTVNLSKCYKTTSATTVADYLRYLPRPIVLLHSQGNTNSDSKNIPASTTMKLYTELLDRMDGTIILLDWDDRVPRIANYRLRHLKDDWRTLDLYDFYALILKSDLMIGVDSGPLYFAQSAGLPIVGYYPNTGHYPSLFSLPSPKQVNIVPSTPTIQQWNRRVRLDYNIVESGESEISGEFIAQTSAAMLDAPKYFDADRIGADVQMQQFVSSWERGRPNDFTPFTDRHRSFDIVLKELARRFKSPLIVETGCIRSAEDWGGAGYGTYLLGSFVERYGGRLQSVDIDEHNCAFARGATRELHHVVVTCADSIQYLHELLEPIDLLFLDSMDTDLPGAEVHCLHEVEAAYPHLHDRSIVLFDDTLYSKGSFIGKGADAVPWLLSRGWSILYSGYQTACIKGK